MDKTNIGADDSKPQMPQQSTNGISRLATASLYMGIYGLASPCLLVAALGIIDLVPIGHEVAEIVGITCLILVLLGPVSSVGGVVLGILGCVVAARSQSETLTKQTGNLGIFASISAITLMVVWIFIIMPSVLVVR